MLNPAYKSIIFHPLIQKLFPKIGESLSVAASHASQRVPTFFGQKYAECFPERRTFSVVVVVAPNSLGYIGLAVWFPGLVGGYTNVKQRFGIMHQTPVGWGYPGGLGKEPRINTPRFRDGAGV